MDNRLEDARQAVHQALEQREHELFNLVAELVKHPSLLGEEASAQHFVADQMSRAGLDVELWELDESLKQLPNAGDSGVPFAGRPNVTGKRAGSGGGRSLILNGHIDVVSPEPVSHWTYDPWGATIADSKMYGRGAHDMKSGVALNLFLPQVLGDLGIMLKGDLILHSVIEEECTGNGALAASLRDKADAAVVTEPTWMGNIQGHVGVIWFKVSVEGRATHVMHAWQGVNAIVKMAPIVLALRDLDNSMNLKVHPFWEDAHHPINLNVGVIDGGDWPSSVPGACEIRCRVSFFPGTDVADVRSEIEATVAAVAAADPWLQEHPPILSYEGFNTNGCLLDPDEPFLEVLNRAHELVLGQPLTAEYSTAVNDQRYYIFAGTPATTYGAEGGNGHGADEWLDLATMTPAAKVLAAFLLEWCGVG